MRSKQTSPAYPVFDRNRLPDPKAYYQAQLPSLRIAGTWSVALCPFHEDRSPSFSVNLEHGGFVCHACGARGGSILDFHMKRYGVRFKEAAIALGALHTGGR